MNEFADYISIPALNWSTLKLLATSPKLLKFREKVPRKDTDPLMFGRAIHCALLEPERWARYTPEPDFGDQRYKENKAKKAAWHASLTPGMTIMGSEAYALAERCAAAVREHREAMALLTGGRSEQTIQWVDADTGIRCKARLDIVRANDIGDLKSTSKESPRLFLSSASTLLYYGAMSWYHDGAVAAGVLPDSAELPAIVAVQTVEPYDVWPFRMTREAYWTGQRLWKSLIRRYAECQAADWWPGAAPTVLDFDVMPWAADGGDDEQKETF